MNLNRLFSPVTINGLALKNRVVMPAIHHRYTPEGFATDRFNEYYWKRAEGGPGLIIVGGCRFDECGSKLGMMSLESDEYIGGWKKFTDGMHSRGTKVAVQLYHAGGYIFSKDLPSGKQVLSPSAIKSNYTKEIPKEMTVEEINNTISNWADGAVRAMKAGFDAIEIIGSAGYLISQFLSPITNHRNDEYGGSWENRCRFPLKVITAVRHAVGKDYPLFMRISGSDFVPNSNTIDDAVRFAKIIQNAGIDAINVTGGWHETKVPQLTGDVPTAGFSYLSKLIKDVVSIPVFSSNRYNDPVSAEESLSLGRADLICVGRPFIADAEWAKKALENRMDEIRPCMSCNQGCLANTFFGKSVECLVNGLAGHEYLYKNKTKSVSKNVLVIGSGPAGCEFSIAASEAGHKVTLYEKKEFVGGQLSLVSSPPAKKEFKNLSKYYETMLKKHEIAVFLKKETTADEIIDGGFDEVVIATGSVPKNLQIDLSNSNIQLVLVNDVLEGKEMPGKNVVIIGGGSVGCETAQLLARQGSISADELFFLEVQKAEAKQRIESLLNSSDRNIAIVEVQKSIGSGFATGTSWPILKDLKRLGVKNYTLSKINEIKLNSITIEKLDSYGNIENIELPCDTLISAIGYNSENNLYESLKDRMPNKHIIGDAQKVGKILDAVKAARILAMNI